MDRAASFFCIIGNCMFKYQTPNISLGKVICSFYFQMCIRDRLCAENMMAALDQAQIMILRHDAAYSAIERIQGFKDAISQYPQYQIVDEIECEGQLEISMPLIAQAITEGVQFDVVMALNDPSALGAVAALQEADKLSEVLVRCV